MSGPDSAQISRLNLLKNRNPTSALGSFDGKVAALATLGGETYFITMNTDYVPALPSLQLPHALFLRLDMRYGTDDPTLWPQQYTAHFCHFPAIAKKGARPELDVMWWDPLPADFVVGSAITRGLGRLHNRCIERFLPFVNDHVALCEQLSRTSRMPISPLFNELIQNILMWIEQLQTLPTTYPKMVFAVTSLQRACLELDALYNYITVYKPCIDEYLSAPADSTPVAQCVGAFTSVPAVAQQLWTARLPFWFCRPTYVFDIENILKVVALDEPTFDVPDKLADEAPPVVYSGNSTEEKVQAIHSAAAQTAWYHNPFETVQRSPPNHSINASHPRHKQRGSS
jgi:hypothetical protein